MTSRAEVLERPVLSAGGRTFRWLDVLETLRAQPAATGGGLLEASAARAAETAFRRARNLLSADDLEGWLEHWGLTLRGWRAQLAGTGADEWTAAVCGGLLERGARELAGGLAAALALGIPIDDADARSAAVARLRQEAGGEDALRSALADARLELARIEWCAFGHADEDVAREAALCAREGQDLAALAAPTGARLTVQRRFAGDVEPAWRPHLTGAAAGDVIGPFALAGAFWVIRVERRAPPALDDPEVRARLVGQLGAAAVRREVAGRIRWHERLEG